MQVIDKEEVLELLGDAEQDARLYDECEAETINKCIRLVKGMKAKEVVRGEWRYYSTTMQECSNCQRHTARHKFKYCPHCGAVMGDELHYAID